MHGLGAIAKIYTEYPLGNQATSTTAAYAYFPNSSHWFRIMANTSSPMMINSQNGVPIQTDGRTEAPRFLVDVAHTLNVLGVTSGDL
jgi:hypothetical protein